MPDAGDRGRADVPDAGDSTRGSAGLSDAGTRVFVRNNHVSDAGVHVRVLSTGHDVADAPPGSAAAFNTLHPSARTASAQESLRSDAQHAPGEAAAAGGCRAPALCPVSGRRAGAFSRARHRHVPCARNGARVPRARNVARVPRARVPRSRNGARVPRTRNGARVPRARNGARVPRARVPHSRVPRARNGARVRGAQRAPGAAVFATGHACVADAGQRAP